MEDDATESVTAHAREAELSARRYIETVTGEPFDDELDFLENLADGARLAALMRKLAPDASAAAPRRPRRGASPPAAAPFVRFDTIAQARDARSLARNSPFFHIDTAATSRAQVSTPIGICMRSVDALVARSWIHAAPMNAVGLPACGAARSSVLLPRQA